MKIFVFSFLVFPILTAIAVYSQNTEKDIDNFLGEGYSKLANKDDTSAAYLFKEGGQIASQYKNWQGCIEASIGLIALKEYSDAQRFLRNAEDIIGDTGGDLRQRIAMANTIAAIPKIQRFALMPEYHLDVAQRMASAAQNWYALAEIARTHAILGNKDKSISCLSEADIIISAHGTPEGYDTLAEIYDMLDMPKESDQCRQHKVSFPKNKLPNANQRVTELTQLDKKQKSWLYLYRRYFEFPYYLGEMDISGKNIYNWGGHMSRNYKLVDGSYIRINEQH